MLIEQLSTEQTRAAVRDGLLILGIAVVFFAVVAGILGAVFGTDGHHGTPSDWLRSAVVLIGLAVHAAVKLKVTAEVSDGSTGHVTFSASWTPLVLTAVVFVIAFFAGRRRERTVASVDTRGLLSASAVTGAVFAIAGAVLAAASTGGVGYGLAGSVLDDATSARVGVDPWLLLPGAFLVLTAGTLWGRANTFARMHGERGGSAVLLTRLGSWGSSVRHARALLIGAVVVTVASAIAFGAYQGMQSASGSGDVGGGGDDFSGKELAGVIIAAALAIPNLILGATGLAMGGSFGANAGGSSDSFGSGDVNGGFGLLSGHVSPSLYLVLLPILLMALVIGARINYGREPQDARGTHPWRTAAVFSGLWLLLGLALRVNVSLSGSAAALDDLGDGSGKVSYGVGLLGLVGVAALWAVVSSVGGVNTARFLATATPRFATRVGGSEMSEEWRLLIADAALNRGAKVPAALEREARAIMSGVRPASPSLQTHPGRDRALLLTAGGLAVSVMALFLGWTIASNTVYSPKHVVEDYFAYLQKKDVDAALSLVSKDTASGLDRTLLTRSALSGVPRVVIGHLDASGDRVTVDAKVAGSPATFTLVKEGHRSGVFPNWRLVEPFTQLDVSSSSGSASYEVNGVPVGGGQYPVFPGSYSVTMAASGAFDESHSTVSADGSSSAEADLELTLNPDLQEAADHALRSYLDQCAASTEAEPTDCPFSYYAYGDVTNVRWQITEYPQFTVDVSDSGDITVSDASGTAHITGTDTDPYIGGPISEDRSFSVNGTVSWGGGDPDNATFSSSY